MLRAPAGHLISTQAVASFQIQMPTFSQNSNQSESPGQLTSSRPLGCPVEWDIKESVGGFSKPQNGRNNAPS